MNTIIKNSIQKLQEICLQHKVKTLYAFGSVCTERFNEKSDIDFVISFKKRFFDGYVDNFLSLEEELQKLYKRDVDIITEDSIQNPYFAKVVNKTKTLIYE